MGSEMSHMIKAVLQNPAAHAGEGSLFYKYQEYIKYVVGFSWSTIK